MLVMKAWLETRWRLTAGLVYCLLFLAINLHDSKPQTSKGVLFGIGMVLTYTALTLPGSGVKSQAPIGFPEGLAESTQFTISLPVDRARLLLVRAAVGMLETLALTLLIACLAWSLLPPLRATVTPADFARLVLTCLLWLTGPYCAGLFFETLVAEPLSMVLAGWALTLLLWVLHHTANALDIVSAFGAASPLVTHGLPWPQMATCAVLAGLFFMAAARVVRTREY